MSGFTCSECGAAATHMTPLTGTNEVPLNDYRCPKHKGSHGYSPIPGVGWVPSKARTGRRSTRRDSRR
jgi:hypothetical protein